MLDGIVNFIGLCMRLPIFSTPTSTMNLTLDVMMVERLKKDCMSV